MGIQWFPIRKLIELEKTKMQESLKSRQESAGVKYDAGKAPMDLISPVALFKLAQVLEFGAKKYASHNWRKGIQWSRVLGAALRHMFKYMMGEDKDPETGLSHLAHAMCCLMFLLEYEETHRALDDRFVVVVSSDVYGEQKTK